MSYPAVIGLEVHVQLKAETKPVGWLLGRIIQPCSGQPDRRTPRRALQAVVEETS